MGNSRETYAFFTVQQIRSLATEALRILQAADENRDFDAPERTQFEAELGHRAAESALIYCSNAIAYLREPSLVDVAVEIAEALAGEDEEDFDRHNGFHALRELAGTGRVTEKLVKLVDHPCDAIRTALAAGFRPDSAESAAQLQKLCGDPNAEVRALARERLQDFKPLAWWEGAFSADPLQGLGAEEAERSRPVIDALAGHLRSRFFVAEVIQPILELAPQAPPVAACDAVRRVLEAVGHYVDEATRRRCVKLLADAGPTGLQTLEALGQTNLQAVQRDLPSLFVEALEPARVEPTLLRWLETLRTPLDQDDSGSRSTEGAYAKAVELHWPLEADPSPLIAAALARAEARPERQWDLATSHLATALAKRGRLDVLAPRLSAQLLRGFTGPWKHIATGCRQALGRLPRAELRDLADRALRSDGEGAVAWGLEQRLKATYDPAVDGSAVELALRLDDDPAVRPAMRRFQLGRVLPRARAELAQGKLSATEAAETLQLCGRFWGGVVGLMFLHPAEGVLDVMRRAAAVELAELDAFLGPEACRVPPTDAERSAHRKARDAQDFKADEEAWFGQLHVLPLGPLEPADRAFLERALAAVPALDSERMLSQLGWVFSQCGEPGDREVFTRLLALCGPDADFAPKDLRKWKAEFVKRLGLGPVGKGKAGLKIVAAGDGSD